MTIAANLVIFGATGDLSRRMLLPALYFLDNDGQLPAHLRIIGAARSKLNDEDFQRMARDAVAARAETIDENTWARFAARLVYRSADLGDSESLNPLGALLKEQDAREDIFYLSISPSHYANACGALKDAGVLNAQSRIVMEKPIGHDLASSCIINACVADAFPERHIFRIDHYLGKETVQNLLAMRFANVLFEPLWNANTIDHVQITVGETIGVEGRRDYYDRFGALRDMVQNHVLQLLCLVAMEPPAKFDADAVRDEKVKVLRCLKPIGVREVRTKTVRGQYGEGVIGAEHVCGYTQEAGGGPSGAETFVALTAEIENWRWAGVPFFIRTGKRLADRLTEIVVQFRAVPHSLFTGDAEADLIANRLTITLQPEEQISLTMMHKTPGLSASGPRLRPLPLNLSLTEAYNLDQPRRRIAYEQLLLDVLNDDATLFVRQDEVEAAWSWVDGIASGWSQAGMLPQTYPAGSWGPPGAFALTERLARTWNT